MCCIVMLNTGLEKVKVISKIVFKKMLGPGQSICESWCHHACPNHDWGGSCEIWGNLFGVFSLSRMPPKVPCNYNIEKYDIVHFLS